MRPTTDKICQMTGLDYFTFVVLIILTGAGLAGAVLLGSFPGKIAAARGHPQEDAIRVAGWLGILTLGLLYPIALIWAYTRPSGSHQVEELQQEVDGLRDRIEAFEQGRAATRENGAASS
jgi:hypothetical protein